MQTYAEWVGSMPDHVRDTHYRIDATTGETKTDYLCNSYQSDVDTADIWCLHLALQPSADASDIADLVETFAIHLAYKYWVDGVTSWREWGEENEHGDDVHLAIYFDGINARQAAKVGEYLFGMVKDHPAVIGQWCISTSGDWANQLAVGVVA